MLQLAQRGAALGLNEAMNWMWSDHNSFPTIKKGDEKR